MARDAKQVTSATVALGSIRVDVLMDVLKVGEIERGVERARNCDGRSCYRLVPSASLALVHRGPLLGRPVVTGRCFQLMMSPIRQIRPVTKRRHRFPAGPFRLLFQGALRKDYSEHLRVGSILADHEVAD